MTTGDSVDTRANTTVDADATSVDRPVKRAFLPGIMFPTPFITSL